MNSYDNREKVLTLLDTILTECKLYDEKSEELLKNLIVELNVEKTTNLQDFEYEYITGYIGQILDEGDFEYRVEDLLNPLYNYASGNVDD